MDCSDEVYLLGRNAEYNFSLLHGGSLLTLFYHPEDGCKMFFRNFDVYF
jgi:hypothetical protein